MQFIARIREAKRLWPNPDACVDADIAAFELAVSLGLIREDADGWDGKKWMFWSANPIGDWLYKVLGEMTKLGILHGEVGGKGVWAPSSVDMGSLSKLIEEARKVAGKEAVASLNEIYGEPSAADKRWSDEQMEKEKVDATNKF